MAHVAKYGKGAIGHLAKHYERAKDENGNYIRFNNQSIDLERTELNYNLAAHQKDTQGDFIRRRCGEVRCLNRDDVKVMCSWVVTAPQELSEDEHRRFFEESYNFLSNRYGIENVISAYVHMDEVQPHMHFAFVPVAVDTKREGFKVSAKDVITKKDLSTFHKDLSKHLERAFGRDVGVLNGATTHGNQSIQQLKNKTLLERNLADMKLQEEGLTFSIESLAISVAQLTEEKKRLLNSSEVDQLTAEKRFLVKGIVIPEETLENFKRLKRTARKVDTIEREFEQRIEEIKKEATIAITKIRTESRTECYELEREKEVLEREIKGFKSANNSLKQEIEEKKKAINALTEELKREKELCTKFLHALEEIEKENAGRDEISYGISR
jgi:tetrahydromethanopterin S-methyltransferase subunit G